MMYEEQLLEINLVLWEWIMGDVKSQRKLELTRYQNYFKFWNIAMIL